MNKKLSLLLTAGIFALLSACGDNAIESDGSKATLNVHVRDASNGLPLRASVKLLSTGATDSTNATTGIWSFDKVSIGEAYSVLVEKEGYASMVWKVSINEGYGMTSVAHENTVYVPLYPLASSLDGYVYYTDKTGKKLPAKDATVRIQLNDQNDNYNDRPSGYFVDKIFEVRAGDDGKFVFPKLPAVGNDYKIWILGNTFNEQAYATQEVSTSSLVLGSATHVPSYEYVYGSANVLSFLGTKSIIGSRDTLVLEFSDIIDAEKFNPGLISISINDYGYNAYNAAVDIILKDNKILLVPVGEWTSGNKQVTLTGNLTSIKGATLSRYSFPSVTVIVNPGALGEITRLELVTDSNTINYNTTYIILRWNKVANATGYKIFAKATTGEYKGSFVQVGSINNGNDNDISTSASLYNTDYFGSYPFAGNSIVFVVQAFNGVSETPLNGAMTLTVADKVAPKISTSSSYYYDYDYYSSSYSYLSDSSYTAPYLNDYFFAPNLSDPVAAGKSGYSCFNFSEPMDTTAVLTGSFVAVAADGENASTISNKVIVETKWSRVADYSAENISYQASNTDLCLTLSTQAGNAIASGTNINARYSISGLKDKSGNPVEISVGTKKINTLSLRINTTVD